MRSILTLTATLFISLSFSQNKTKSEVFGIFQDGKPKIIGDTLTLKTRMMELLFSNNKEKPTLTIQIKKGQTFGESVQDYYFILLEDKRKNISIAKWLEKIDDELIIVNTFNGENYWQVLSTACIGTDDCFPEVAIIDKKKQWVCGHKLICSKDSHCTKTSAIETE